MLFLSHDPFRLIPYHLYDPKRLHPFPEIPPDSVENEGVREERKREAVIPRIPVLEIPGDLRFPDGRPLRDLGDYVLYNGHHRRWSALLAGVRSVEIAVLHCDEDLKVNEGTELLNLTPPSADFVRHRDMVFDRILTAAVEVLEEEHRLLLLSQSCQTA